MHHPNLAAICQFPSKFQLQLANFSSTYTLPSSLVANDETLVILLFGFLLMYYSSATF